MGSLLPKLEHRYTDLEAGSMSARTANGRNLRKSKVNPSKTVQNIEAEEQTSEVHNTGHLINKRHLAVDVSDREGTKKQKNNSSMMPNEDVLTSLQTVCSTLSSIGERVENIEHTITQKNRMFELLGSIQSFVEQISRSLESQHISSTSNSTEYICHTNTYTSGGSRHVLESASGCSEVKSARDIIALQHNTSVFPESQNIDSAKVGRIMKDCEVVTEAGISDQSVSGPSNVDNEYKTIGKHKTFLNLCKIKSYMQKLNIDDVENEFAVTEKLLRCKDFLSNYPKNSSQRITEITEQLSLKIDNVLSNLTRRWKKIILNGNNKDVHDELKRIENYVKSCNNSNSGSCEMISLYLSLFKKYLAANKLIEMSDKKHLMESVERISECFRNKVSKTENIGTIGEMNPAELKNSNQQTESHSSVVTENPVRLHIKPSIFDGTDESNVCRAIAKLELKTQEEESIPAVRNDSSGETRRKDEIKLQQLKKRRDEIKSEINSFVGTNHNPKFYELNEYSTRLLLELDDLSFPKGSDLHGMKREILKEVYQFSDILDKKANDSRIMEAIEIYLSSIKNIGEFQPSDEQLRNVSGYLNQAKTDLGIIDPKNNLEERKQACSLQIVHLENVVSNMRNRFKTYSSVTSCSKKKCCAQESEKQRNSADRSAEGIGSSEKATRCLNDSEITPLDQCSQSDSTRRESEIANNNDIKKKISEDQQTQKLMNKTEESDMKKDSGDPNRISLDYSNDNDKYSETNTNHSRVVIFDMEKTINRSNEEVGRFMKYDSRKECGALKHELLSQWQRVEDIKNDAGREYEPQICELRGKLLNLLNCLGKHIDNLRIGDIEKELKVFNEQISTEEETIKLRNRLIHLWKELEQITSNDRECRQRLKVCHGIIQNYLDALGGEKRPCYTSTDV